MDIPNLPTLSAGAHNRNEGKACIMEYVSLLAGEDWSDSPKCTHPLLTEVARGVNDRLTDSDRHLLVPLIGRLFGTTVQNRKVARAIIETRNNHVGWKIMTTSTCMCDGCKPLTKMWLESENIPPVSEWPQVYVQLLNDMIDAYDEAAGRTEHREITNEDYEFLTTAVG